MAHISANFGPKNLFQKFSQLKIQKNKTARIRAKP